MLPSIRGAPNRPGRRVTPSNLSGTARAKRIASSFCPSPRMEMAKALPSSKWRRLGDVERRLHRIRGGSSDTDEKELTVSATGWSVADIVLTIAKIGRAHV